MSYQWKSNPKTVARMLDSSTIGGFRAQDIILEPTESLTIIQDGKIVDTFTEQRVKKAVGGLSKKLFWGRKTTEKFLFAVTTPLQLQLDFTCMSQDAMQVKGAISLDLQIQFSDAKKLLNLFSVSEWTTTNTEGDVSLTRFDLAGVLSEEVLHKVLQREIGKHPLSEIRGNENIQSNIRDLLLTELRRTYAEFGLTFRQSHVVFSENAHDSVQKLRGEFNLQRGEEKIQQDARLFALEDQAQLIHRQIELEAEAQVLIARGEDAVDLQHKMAALKAQEAEFQQNFEQMLQAKEAELAQKREQMELEEAAGDRDLERRMQAGETTAQEREYLIERQRQRDQLQSDQLDKSREMASEQLDRTQVSASDQVGLMQELIGLAKSGESGTPELAGVLQTLIGQQAETQRRNMEQQTEQQKELMKQQTAQQFLDGDHNGDVTLVQGNLYSGAGGHQIAQGNPPQATPPPPTCNSCGQGTRFIHQYQRWYCDRCRVYV